MVLELSAIQTKAEPTVEPDFDATSAGEDETSFRSFHIVQLVPSIPFQVSFRLPFSENRISIGKDSFERLRRRTRLNPEDANAHIMLAAQLLSGKMVSSAQAGEAVQHLRIALRLMPPAEGGEREAQGRAMTHKFLGDALNGLGERAEARRHWEQAVALDPIAPPYGFSGPAQEMLDNHPLT